MKTTELKDKVILNLANNCMGEIGQLETDLCNMKVAVEMVKESIINIKINENLDPSRFISRRFSEIQAELLFAKHGAAIAIAISFACVNAKFEQEIERILKEQFPGADFVEDPSNVISVSQHRTVKVKLLSKEEVCKAYEQFPARLGGQDWPPFEDL